MFDIGFAELMLVALVALLVLGPERLPKAARTVGYWGGRARSYMRQMTTELEREVQQAEIREQIEKTRQTLNKSVDLEEQLGLKETPAASDSAKKQSSQSTPAAQNAVDDEPQESPLASREAQTLSAWERAQEDAAQMEAELNAELEADAARASEAAKAEAEKAKEPPANG